MPRLGFLSDFRDDEIYSYGVLSCVLFEEERWIFR